MAHVFISYVRENSRSVNKLERALAAKGVKVWLDRNDIAPGEDWQNAIRRAILGGDFFIACFSKEYNARGRSYMNQELKLAIDELSKRPDDQVWFIPVLFSGQVPDISIGAGKTLQSIQWVELTQNKWKSGLERIIKVIKPKEIPTVEQPANRPTLGLVAIPVLGRIIAGNATPIPDAARSTFPEKVTLTRDLVPDPDNLYALYVKGESLEDASIHDGDIVIMRHQQVAENGDFVAVWLKEEHSTTLKRYYREPHKVRLQSANPTFEPIYKNPKDVEIHGKVVLVIRQLERAR
ncbi:MAG: TIR domain-containing protein [Anaerolineae bacterium]